MGAGVGAGLGGCQSWWDTINVGELCPPWPVAGMGSGMVGGVDAGVAAGLGVGMGAVVGVGIGV